VQELETPGPIIGLPPMMDFENTTVDLPANAELLLYSDGAIEIENPEGKMANQEDFTGFATSHADWNAIMDQCITRARELRGQPVLNDDCSLMLIRV
jgi:sigma-B regulation protein RsbU (phosphoserine phosphatase)